MSMRGGNGDGIIGQTANFILLEQDGKASKPTVSDIIFDGESVM